MNKTLLSSVIAAVITGVVLSSCGTSKQQAEDSSFDRIDSLRSHFLAIEDTLLFNWNVMINDDNERLSDMSRLLDELHYANAIDSTNAKELKSKIKQLKADRYYMTKMTSEEIDKYDSATFAMAGNIKGMIDNFEEAQRYPFMEELINSIRDHEGKILMFRVKYDRIAKTHNDFVRNHGGILDQIDPEYHHTELPLFQLSTE